MQLFKKGLSYVAIQSIDGLMQGEVYSVRSEFTPGHHVVVLCHKKHSEYEYPYVYRIATHVAMKALLRVQDGFPDARELLDKTESLKNILNRTFHVFPKVFINNSNELILVPKHNVYFNLTDVHSDFDFKMKMFAWLSRPISKGLNRKPAYKLLDRFNRLINTQFTISDMELIYTRLGNDVNPDLTAAFIQSGYDMNLLTETKETAL